MACVDTRQLTQAQREAGFEQLRNAGVVQAVRPFSGSPTLPNLVDYINRELFPAVKRTREKVNDVYRPVTDNAPSANPLAYFFSDETANADPTTGRLRLDNATQDLATTVRVSQTNARLKDVASWLDVMAGSATTPLGTLTLFHVGDPSRFIRFDLTAMVDVGAYWNLTVSPLESSHDSPFLDSDGVVLAFIPGVAGAGATVPPSAITPIAADTFLGNITTSTAAPVAVPLASIDSTSIIYDAPSHTFQRAALTGFAIAAQNDNTTTSGDPFVTYTTSSNMSAERVLSNGTGTTVDIGTAGQIQIDVDTPLTDGDKGDITVSSNGTVWNIDADVVTNTELANMAAGTVKGRQIDGGSGDPVDLTGFETTELLRYETIIDTTSTGTITSYAPTGLGSTTTGIRFSPFGGSAVLRGMVLDAGQMIVLRVGRGSGSNTVTLNHEDTSAAAESERFNCPNNVALVLRAGEACVIRNAESRNNIVAAGRTSVADADYGDITVSSNGSTWTIDNNAVSDAKLRDSGALSVIGRSANSSGDPADISAVAAGGGVLRESGSTIGFGTITLAAFPSIADDTFLANVSGGAAQPTAVALTTLAGAGLTGGADAILAVGAGTYVTVNANDVAVDRAALSADLDSTSVVNNAGVLERAALTGDVTAAQNSNATTIANDAVTNAKAANMTVGTVKGRAIDAGSTGDPQDLTGQQVGSLSRFGASESLNLAPGTHADVAVAATTNIVFINVTAPGDVDITGWAVAGGNNGAKFKVCKTNNTGRVVLKHDASATFVNKMYTPGAVDFILAAQDDGVVLDHDSGGGVFRLQARMSATLTDGDKGDITVATSGTSWTIDNDVVSNAKLANMAQSTIKGRAEGAGTGDPTDLTPTQVAAIIDGEAITWTAAQTFSGAVLYVDDHVEAGALPYNITIGDTVNKLFINTAGDGEIQTIGGTTSAGRIVEVYILASGLKTIVHSTGAGSLQMPGSRNHVLGQGQSFKLIGNNPGSGWRVSYVPVESGTDKGDISINSSGSTWTIDNNAVSDAKLRDSAAVSVIGRSANSTGDPADIVAAANNRVLARSGDALVFMSISTALVDDAAITLAKMANLGQSRIIGRAEGAGSGAPTALTPTEVVAIIDGENATWTGTHSFTGGFGVDVAGDVTVTAGNDATGTLTLAGNDGAAAGGAEIRLAAAVVVEATTLFRLSTGNPLVERLEVEADGAWQVNGSTGTSGQVLVSQGNAASPEWTTLANAGLADMAQSRIKGRAEGAGTGAPTDLTPTQVVSIIDGENVTWAGAHTFDSQVQFDSTVRLSGILSNSTNGTIDNLAIGSVNVVRFSAADLLTGMVAAEDNQTVLIVNGNSTDNLQIGINHVGSSSANRFVGSGTERIIRPEEFAIAWYDTTFGRWRLLCRDDASL